jgi:hypothetical protein
MEKAKIKRPEMDMAKFKRASLPSRKGPRPLGCGPKSRLRPAAGLEIALAYGSVL